MEKIFQIQGEIGQAAREINQHGIPCVCDEELSKMRMPGPFRLREKDTGEILVRAASTLAVS
jgi:hypothetical protein